MSSRENLSSSHFRPRDRRIQLLDCRQKRSRATKSKILFVSTIDLVSFDQRLRRAFLIVLLADVLLYQLLTIEFRGEPTIDGTDVGADRSLHPRARSSAGSSTGCACLSSAITDSFPQTRRCGPRVRSSDKYPVARGNQGDRWDRSNGDPELVEHGYGQIEQRRVQVSEGGGCRR